MKDIIWSSTLSVEVREIDEDHQRLVDLFNMLSHSVDEGDDSVYVEAVLEELISCTAWHFKHEERLMLKYGFDGYANHKAEHEELIKSARALQQTLFREGKQISSEEIEFLEHWLTEHILVTDMTLGAFLVDVM